MKITALIANQVKNKTPLESNYFTRKKILLLNQKFFYKKKELTENIPLFPVFNHKALGLSTSVTFIWGKSNNIGNSITSRHGNPS